VEAYLRFVQALAREAKSEGLTPLEAAAGADLGEYHDWLDHERLAGNLRRAYSELDGEPLGAPIDIAGSFADMIALNGGRPLRCLA
jgi:cyclase